MLEQLESPPNVVAVRCVAQIEKSDFETVLEPAIQKLLAEHDELRAVIVIGDEYEGMTAGGSLEDVKFGFAHWSKWKRCAVVTNKDWVRHGTGLFGWMIPGDVKVFELEELEPAIEWAAAAAAAER
jgi:hypothetical protein